MTKRKLRVEPHPKLQEITRKRNLASEKYLDRTSQFFSYNNWALEMKKLRVEETVIFKEIIK